MRPVSAEFLVAIAQRQSLISTAVLTDTNGNTHPLNLIEGSVTLDATSAIRGSAELSIIDTDLIPEIAGDPLTPYGSEVQIRRGLILPTGGQKLISLGHFPIATTSIADSGEGLDMRLTLYDRARKVSRDKVESVYQVKSGTLFVKAILDVVQRTYPDVENTGFYDGGSPTIDYVTPIVLAIEEQSDPWEFAQNMAMAIGCDLYFDGDGVLTLRSVTDREVRWTIAEGTDGVLLHLAKDWSDEEVHNKWIVTAETGGELVLRGEAIDDDPASPTFYGGPFGRVVRWESIEYVETTNIARGKAQVKTVAELLKAREMGKAQALDFGSLVNPALEPDDVVRITRERSKVDEDHVLDQVQIPLTVEGEMSGRTRTVRL